MNNPAPDQHGDREFELSRVKAMAETMSHQANWISKLFFYLMTANTAGLAIAFNTVLAEGRFADVASEILTYFAFGAGAGMAGFSLVNLAINSTAEKTLRAIARIENAEAVKHFMTTFANDRIAPREWVARTFVAACIIVSIGGLGSGISYAMGSSQGYFKYKAEHPPAVTAPYQPKATTP
ncbi:hypothetical protein [Phyllobacterium chamaecytisi]|uniref:hypothetical protein n=1 Tax=Phyllobacterium chamaecytisi TaxID=2876082 RepID=UPI001CC9E5DD|nr:hypothetical protein [Phyllobacterium sp. KW56]MBZ9604263.1 hypothetical protein [Phyllobacterium sp. KW56]